VEQRGAERVVEVVGEEELGCRRESAAHVFGEPVHARRIVLAASLYNQEGGREMATHTARVLVVDGEEGVRTGLFRALLDRGIFCDCSASGGDAIDRLGRTPYAMVILDFSLPGAGAAAVIEALRVMPQDERPMVIATASIDSL